MKKNFFYPSAFLALVSLASCATPITKLNTAGPNTYKINASGFSENVQPETIVRAESFCRDLKKEYLFIRNAVSSTSVIGIDMISYDLIFSCAEPGSAHPAPPAPEKDAAQKALEEAEKLRLSKEKLAITGDTPGAPESLGIMSQQRAVDPEKQEGDIIEEKILE